MSQPANFRCPHCQTVFSISDPSLYGRQILCPSCRNTLVINAPQPAAVAVPAQPAPAVQQTSPFDNLPASNQVPLGNFNPAPRPPQLQAPQRKGRKKAKKKKSTAWVYPVIAVVAVAGILIPAVWFATSMLGGNRGSDGNIVDMTWLPADLEQVTYIDVDKVVNSKFVGEQIKNNPMVTMQLGGITEQTGLTLADIDSVTIGGRADNSNSVIVVRLKKPVDASALEDAEASEVNGRMVYSFSAGKLLAADDLTMVVSVGRGEQIEKLANDGPVARRFTKFDFVDSGQDILMCVVPDDASGYFAENAKGLQTPNATKLSQAMDNKTKAVALGGSFSGNDLDLKAQALLQDKEASAGVKEGALELLGEAKKLLGQSSNLVPPQIASVAGEVLGSASVKASGDLSTLTVTLPLDELSKISEEGFPGASPFGGPSFGSPFN